MNIRLFIAYADRTAYANYTSLDEILKAIATYKAYDAKHEVSGPVKYGVEDIATGSKIVLEVLEIKPRKPGRWWPGMSQEPKSKDDPWSFYINGACK